MRCSLGKRSCDQIILGKAACYDPLQETHITHWYIKGSDKSFRKDICLNHRPLYLIMDFSDIISLSIIANYCPVAPI